MMHTKHTQSLKKSLRVLSTLLILMASLPMPVRALPEVSESKNHTALMTHLLTAEIALTRKQPDRALQEYLAAIRMTEDPSVAQQATLLAIQLEKPKEAIESAVLWAQYDPNNLQAQLVAATLLISVSRSEALPFLTHAIEIAPAETDQQLSSIQSRLSDASRKQLRSAVQTIARNRTNDPYAQLIAAHQAAQEEDIQDATFWVDSALNLSPKLTKAIELKARLIRYVNDSDTQALNYLDQKISQNPSDSELRLFYANALLDVKRFKEAVEQLSTITEDKIFGGQALLLLGEYHLGIQQPNKAQEELLKAITFIDAEDTAHYLLGQLFEQQRKTKSAIEHYSEVTKGSDHIPAFIKAATLLSAEQNYNEALELLHAANPISIEEEKQLILTELDILVASNQLETAMTLADNVLLKIPQDIDMRLKHSAIAEKMNQPHIAEIDLKAILQIDPKQVQALSALGLLLSKQKDREQEAIEYLTRALELDPNNPEYLDNIGWLYYKMGDTQKALVHIKKAYDQDPNDKIATHLGEVLKKPSH